MVFTTPFVASTYRFFIITILIFSCVELLESVPAPFQLFPSYSTPPCHSTNISSQLSPLDVTRLPISLSKSFKTSVTIDKDSDNTTNLSHFSYFIPSTEMLTFMLLRRLSLLSSYLDITVMCHQYNRVEMMEFFLPSVWHLITLWYLQS